MVTREGVIQFELTFEETGPLTDIDLIELDFWRGRLRQLGMVGEDPQRYDGYGFGNLSMCLPGGEAFVITGSQTGALPVLGPEHYACVTYVDLTANQVEASGAVKPSSESLTHAALYVLDPEIRFVFHGHDPGIWGAAVSLGIPETAKDIAYGTPAMAAEMERLYATSELADRGVLAMRGHEDGVISFGATAAEAGERLVNAFRDAHLK